MKPELRSLLKGGLASLGLEHSDKTLVAFDTYLFELMRWNKAYNLTSIRNERDVITSHFLDSALYVKALPEGAGSIADIGSGGGFPGLVMKILRPELKLYLIEPSGKKCAFLRNMQRKLSLDGVTVMEGRVEDVAGMQVDVAVTRALFAASEFTQKASHILSPGGTLILSKGPKVAEELESLSSPHRVMDMKLPGEDIIRHLVIISPR